MTKGDRQRLIEAEVFRTVASMALQRAQYTVATSADFEAGMKRALIDFSDDLHRLARRVQNGSNPCPTRPT